MKKTSMIMKLFLAALAGICAGAINAEPSSAAQLAAPFNLDYTLVDLGSVPGVPSQYGGLTLTKDNKKLLIGGYANTSSGNLYAVGVIRDAQNHITGFSGTAAFYAGAAYNEGGVAYGPGDVLFLARWPAYAIGQIKPGSTITNKIISTSSSMTGGSPSGLAFVPSGFPGEGQLKVATYPSGYFYTLTYAPDGLGTYDITSFHLETIIGGGPEGMVYIHPTNAHFAVNSMLISEYSYGSVAAYEIDTNGNPIPNTRRNFITGLTGAEGAFIDPVTGDFLFSTFGGGNHVMAVRGFVPPVALTNVRVIETLSTQGNELDAGSISAPTYTVTQSGNQTMLEWRFDNVVVNTAKTIAFDVIMKNPSPGEQRLISSKVEVLYNDVNGNPVRTELDPQYVNALASAFAASLSTDKSSYQANENIAVAASINNMSGYARTIGAKITIEDSQGSLVQELALLQSISFAAGETISLGSFTFNTGANFAGDYRIHLVLTENQVQAAEAIASFKINPTFAASASITTDKVSYNPRESATISATITSASANYVLENLAVTLSIGSSSPGGTIYTATKTVSALMPGGVFSFKSYWNTGTYAPGTYPVTIEVKDASGTVLATATQNLVIASVVKPSVVLKGRITVDRQSLLAGDPATVSYSVTNKGNSDLADVGLSVQVVHVANQTVYDNLASQATLSMGGMYTGSGTINTTTYSAMDYLVVLRATIAGMEETLSGTYFRVEGAPTVPALISPAMGSDVDTFTPTLTVSNASDPNDDRLTYEFELYADSGLGQLVAMSSGINPDATGTGVTTWTVPAPLRENAVYSWRARAYDGKLYGPWMATASVRVNTVNDPPTAPAPTSPADTTSVSVLTPVLTITNATDPDSTGLTYNFEIALDPDFTLIVATTKGVSEGSGATSWQLPTNLTENTWYYWRAQADDWQIEGPWSTTASFFVNTANDAPGAPAVLTPANGSSISLLATDITVSNGTDLDSAVLTYFFEFDTATTFDSPNLVRSNGVAEDQGTTLWNVAGLLDNTWYFVRAKASDGQAESPWSAVSSFFANTTNDPPRVPILANPSDGSGVNVFTPTLSVYDSTDLDKDVLTYEFEVYGDVGMTNLIAKEAGIAEAPRITSWTVAIMLTENQTYYWRCRAFDAKATSAWSTSASFFVNTANDAPGAPVLNAPAEASSITTLTPALSITNAVDPDSDRLVYDFELSSAGVVVLTVTGVPQDPSGITTLTITAPLLDNTVYQWRARAYDGDRYGPWMAMASFMVHIPQTGITVEIEFEPETLNKGSKGTWVMVEIELPRGYQAKDVDISSIRLEGTVPAEAWPFTCTDHDDDSRSEYHHELKVKFKRSDVINVLPVGQHVPVHVTGRVGTVTFEGMDTIRVIK